MRLLIREIRQTVRSLAQSPGFTALVVLTLALGIGANATVFSVADALLLRPLPYKNADRLVRIESVRGGEAGEISLRELQDIEELTGVFSEVAAYRSGAQYNTSGDGAAPEEVPATLCSRDLFGVLDVPFVHGGPWPPEYEEDESFGIVLNNGFWKRRFGGDPGIVGKKITLDGAPFYTVFGVLPPGFDFPGANDLFRSVVIVKDDVLERDRRRAYGLARLGPGVHLEKAQAEVNALVRRLTETYPETNRGVGFRLVPLRDLYAGEARPYLFLLLGGVGFLLLIACSNVINLLLSRAMAREREVAIRAALGAGRAALVRRRVTEGLLLSLLGGAAGLLLALFAVRALSNGLGALLPLWMKIGIDGRVLAFTAAVAVTAGLLAAVAPAVQAARPSLTAVLGESGRGASAGRNRQLLRRSLVAAEIALALMLLAGAGLLGKSLNRLFSADPGFQADGLLTFRIALSWRTYESPESIASFYRQALHEISTIPGVEAVATNSNLPLSGESGEQKSVVTLEGQSLAEQQENPYVEEQRVSPGYFRIMSIPVVEGRVLTEDDRSDTRPVAVVSRSFAERFWPGESPLGKRIKPGKPGDDVPWFEIVGVVGDVHHDRIGEAGLSLYRSLFQRPHLNAYVLMRGRIELAQLIEPVNRAVWKVDRDQSTFDFILMADRMAETLWRQRISGILFGAFAFLATVLAGVGIFGVTSYAVGQRTREIGIRMALGARPGDVLGLVLWETAVLAVAGLAVGLVAGLALARLLSSLLFGVSSTDPVVFFGVSLLLATVALAAGLLPAYRAARVDPLLAIRSEEALS